MYVTCSACETRYEVPDDAITAKGRRVRCANCGYTWTEVATGQRSAAKGPTIGDLAATAEAVVAEETAAEEERAARAATEDRKGDSGPKPDLKEDKAPEKIPRLPEREDEEEKSGNTRVWVLAALLVVAVAAGLWYKRDQVVAKFPQAAPIYESLGIAVSQPAPPLQFANLRRLTREIDGVPQLVVEGEVVNRGEQSRSVPPIKVDLKDEGGTVLASMTVSAEESELAPGARTVFRGEMPDPPAAAADFQVQWVEAE